jgi:hypothetical protein
VIRIPSAKCASGSAFQFNRSPDKKQRPELAFRAFGFCVLLVSLLAEAGDQAGEE